MNNIIAFDVASEVTYVHAINQKGKLIIECAVPTQIPDLEAVIRKIPKQRTLVFEEGCQASWLWSELSPFCNDVIVCDPRANKLGLQKSDRIDARKLAELARLGALKRVWHGGKELQGLRQMVLLYLSLTKHSTRLKNQIKTVFRSVGISGGSKAYIAETRTEAISKLPNKACKLRVEQLSCLLDEASEQRAKALKLMIKSARQFPRYKELRTIDGIGPKFSAFILAVIGDARRFRTRKQLWAYSGLAVTTHSSGEYEVHRGSVRRKQKKTETRGLVRHYNHILKYVFKQVAMTLSRGKWKEQYSVLLSNSKNANNAQLTLARKIAAVVLHIIKTGEKYDLDKVFKKQ